MADIGYYNYTPTYVGMPVEEYKNYTQELAKEYDITRDSVDLVSKAMATINPAFDKDKEYIDTVNANIKTSLAKIATDMQGGLRYETGRNQVREIVNTLNNDPKIVKIKENAERKRIAEKNRVELNAKGYPTITFGDNKNFSSISADGTLQDYNETVQPRGEWDKAKLNVINRVRAVNTSIFDKIQDEYIRTGTISELTLPQYEKVKNEMVAAYVDSNEGFQQYSDLKQKGLNDKQIADELGKDMLDLAKIGLGRTENYNYQQIQPNPMDLFEQKQRFMQSLKQQGQSSGEAQYGYFTGRKSGEAISITNNSNDISDDMFDKGRLRDEYETKETVLNPMGAIGGTIPASKITKTKTTKQRAMLDKIHTFMDNNGKPKRSDEDAYKFWKKSSQQILSREIVTLDPDTIKGMEGSNLIYKDVKDLPLSDVKQFKLIGGDGEAKELGKLLNVSSNKEITSVKFHGITTVADSKNGEKPGDLVYTINVGNKSYDVVQDLGSVDKDLAKKLQPYNQLLKGLNDIDLTASKNITNGKVFRSKELKNNKGEIIQKSDLVSFGTIGGTSDTETIGLLPVIGFDKNQDKLTYTLQPKFKIGDNWYNLNEQEINSLYTQNKIDSKVVENLNRELNIFKATSNNNDSLNYEDIQQDMQKVIETHSRFQQYRATAKTNTAVTNAQNINQSHYDEQP